MITIWLLRADLFCIALILIYIAWQDILIRTISHWCLIILTILIFIGLFLQHRYPNIIAASMVLFFGFILFSTSIVGGGDVKLVSVLSLAMEQPVLATFFIEMTILGAVIALVGAGFFRKSFSEHGVPYAVPIVIAYLFTDPSFPIFY